jgi:hypothetical protein
MSRGGRSRISQEAKVLKDFIVSREFVCPFGSGHTLETDPTKKGWKIRSLYKGSEVWLIGRPGIQGCATAQYTVGGQIGIKLFPEATPLEVATGKTQMHAEYDMVRPDISGWALYILDKLEA